MVAAFFVWLSGLGLILHSCSMALFWTPALLAVMAVELKLVEEPELERRFGEPCWAYKARVPLFNPKRPLPPDGNAGQDNRDEPDEAHTRG